MFQIVFVHTYTTYFAYVSLLNLWNFPLFMAIFHSGMVIKFQIKEVAFQNMMFGLLDLLANSQLYFENIFLVEKHTAIQFYEILPNGKENCLPLYSLITIEINTLCHMIKIL